MFERLFDQAQQAADNDLRRLEDQDHTLSHEETIREVSILVNFWLNIYTIMKCLRDLHSIYRMIQEKRETLHKPITEIK